MSSKKGRKLPADRDEPLDVPAFEHLRAAAKESDPRVAEQAAQFCSGLDIDMEP